MLPSGGDLLTQPFELKKQPSRTYQLGEGHIRGMTDGLEAIRQAIYCILETERFGHLIYSWNYGVELKRLYGKTPGLIESKLKKRIRAALLQDDRIQKVGDFLFSHRKGALSVTFTVETEAGSLTAETEVIPDV